MKTLQNKNREYNLIEVEVISGNLYLLNKLIKKHNDYRGIVEDNGTYSLAMYLHQFRMDSPYTNDDTGDSNYLGYGLATIAVLPHITKVNIHSAIENDNEMYNRIFVKDL